MRKLAKNSKNRVYLQNIGKQAVYPCFNKETQLWEYKLGEIKGVYSDKLSSLSYATKFGISYLIDGFFLEVVRCWVVDDEQIELSKQYGIKQGDKVGYFCNEEKEGTVLCLFDDCIRTDTDGIRGYSEILTVNGQNYNI